MADIDAYKDKFSDSGRRVLETALDESRRRDQNYVSIEHILHAVAREEEDLFTSTMRDLAVDPRSVKLLIEKRLDSGRQHSGKAFALLLKLQSCSNARWTAHVRRAAESSTAAISSTFCLTTNEAFCKTFYKTSVFRLKR